MTQPAPHPARLPYAYAKAHGVILGASTDAAVEVFFRAGAA